MSIIYIHGVKVRSDRHGSELGKSFQRWLSPKISVNNVAPSYEAVYWGDTAAKFHWNLASRPRTPLLSAGGTDDFAGLGALRGVVDTTVFDTGESQDHLEGPVLNNPLRRSPRSVPSLESVSTDKREDLVADLYLACRAAQSVDPVVDIPEVASLAAASSSVAGRWDEIMSLQGDDESRAKQIVAEVDAMFGNSIVDMGGFADWMESAGEHLRRAVTWPTDAIGTVLGEGRPYMNEFIAYFLGDVFTYLVHRGNRDQVGEIPHRVLTALRRAQERKKVTGEKIVVVTHSMGGQLLYDAISHFAQGDRVLDGLEIDHWVSCGCQVSLFAEMRLFLDQSLPESGKLPMPSRVKSWTNYYDFNDLVGFVMKPVFEGVEDLEYDTGYGLVLAHTGFLGRPSFFKAISARL